MSAITPSPVLVAKVDLRKIKSDDYPEINDVYDHIQKKVNEVHARELVKEGVLRATWSQFSSWLDLARSSTSFAFARYVFKGVQGIIYSSFLNPLAFISDPISATYGTFMCIILFSGLLLGEIGLWFFFNFGGGKLCDWISRTYGYGWSIINWSYPNMFADTWSVEAAKKSLVEGSVETKLNERSLLCKKYQAFDLDVCRTFLLMASLIYERDDRFVKEASKNPAYASELLLKSEEKINYIARNCWNMRFVSISDFTTAGGAFCGVYYEYNADQPYIVLVFKGTGPTNFAEWLVDASYVREEAGDFLFGTCHQGFYTALFPASGTDARELPYETIIETLKFVASEIRANLEHKSESSDGSAQLPKIQLYVAGHSLGAALASLCYSRFLKSEEDLGDDIELRDAYCFGTPRTGDAQFATEWEGCMTKPSNQHRNLFRIANRQDIVARVPAGLADRRSDRSSIASTSLLNYGAIGTELTLPSFGPSAFVWNKVGVKPGRDMRICEQPGGDPRLRADLGNLHNPIGLQNYFGFLYSFLYDHFPTGYYNSLQDVASDATDLDKLNKARLTNPPANQDSTVLKNIIADQSVLR